MGQPAARQNDSVTATDTHIVMVPSAGGPVPTPQSLPFNGTLVEGLSTTVMIDNLPAATKDSVAQNVRAHAPIPPGTAFQNPPSNRGTVMKGSATVLIDGKQAARVGDEVLTCNDPEDAPVGQIAAGSATVMIG